MTFLRRMLLERYDEAITMTAEEIDEEVKEHVQKGIELLKEKWGDDFVDHIDPLLLDLGSAFSCVLGQLYDNADPSAEQWEYLYTNGVIHRPLSGWGEEHNDGYMKGLAILDGDVALDPPAFGFDTYDGGYEDLQAAWLHSLRAEVKRRGS